MTRSILASHIPLGYETTFFSFLQITGGASAWICPLLIGLINDHYHSYRLSFLIVILPFFFLGLVILFFFDDAKAAE